MVRFQFDPNEVRLNNLGQPATVPSGHAAQSPTFNTLGAHYLELSQNANTQLGQGLVVYHAPETNAGGATAIDFNQSKIVAEGAVFLKIPLRILAQGLFLIHIRLRRRSDACACDGQPDLLDP